MAGPRTSADPRAADGASWDARSGDDHPPEEVAPEPERAPDPSRHPTRLPSWARFPRVAGSPAGPAFPPEAEEAPLRQHDEETESVLWDLDHLHEEIRGKGSAPPAETEPPVPIEPPAPVAPSAPAAPAPRVEPAGRDLWESPSSYLEERLRLANDAASEIVHDVRSIEATWSRVVTRINALENEVARANEEMTFIRTGQRDRHPVTGTVSAAPLPSLRPAPAHRAAPVASYRGVASPRAASSAPPVFAGFTASRYNQTIGELKARRRKLAGATLVAAGAISVALVVVTALAAEPLPPVWLAVLPAVWMIPVPFFVLSFRGTQRVLRHNHLEVPPGEAT